MGQARADQLREGFWNEGLSSFKGGALCTASLC